MCFSGIDSANDSVIYKPLMFCHLGIEIINSLASSVCLVLVPNRKCQLKLSTCLLDLEVKNISYYLATVASPDGPQIFCINVT